MKRLIAVISFFLLGTFILKLPSLAQNKWTIDQILKTERLKSPVISPDGKYIFYQVGYTSQGYPAKTMEFFTVSVDGKSTFNLPINISASSYRWSPDSKWISYIDKGDDKNNIRQVWGMSPTGGKPRQLTFSEHNIGQYGWNSEGTFLYYTTYEGPSEEETAYKKKWGEVISPEEKKWSRRGILWIQEVGKKSVLKLVDETYGSFSPKWSPDGKSIAFLSVGKNEQVPELYIINIADGKTPELLTDTKTGIRFFSWSPDSKAIAYITAEQDIPEYINYFRPNPPLGPAHIHIYHVDSHSSRQITNSEYPELTSFIWSRDSKKLVFIAQPPETKDLAIRRRYILSQMYVITVSDGNIKAIADGTDYYLGGTGITWSGDDSEIWFVNGDKIGSNLFAVDVSTGKVRHITRGKDCIQSVSYNKDFTAVSFTKQNVNMKPDIYVSGLPAWTPRRITDINPWVDEFANPQGEVINYRSEGRDIESLLIKPPDFNSDKKYPLILVIHGGPAWYKLNEWLPDWEQSPIHAYSSEGFVLLFPNVRGSANYGVDFRKDNHHDLGGGDFRDAMRGVDYLLDMGYIDEDRMGVCGWSYGGFLTPSIITQTDRFKAAQLGAGLPSLEAMYGRMHTVEGLVHGSFDTRPWENGMTHLQYSPLYYTNKVKTPTLIQHGEKDPRCPVAEAILFYKALKYYGVPTVLEIYPEMGHSITDSLLYRRILTKNLDWFKKWLKDDKTTSFEDIFPSE